jgi:ATP-binding cassette, subfamily B, bacterial PglK
VNVFKQLVKDLLFLSRLRKKTLAGFLVFFFLVSMIDLIGIGLVGGYVAVITTSPVESLPGFLSGIAQIDVFGKSRVMVFGAILVVIFLLKAVFAIWVNRKILKFSAQLMVDLRKKVMRSFQNQSYEQYLQRNTGHYIRATSAYVVETGGAVVLLLSITSESIVIVATIVFLMITNVVAVAALIGLIGGVFFLFDRAVRGKIRNASLEMNQSAKELTMSVTEGFKGFKEIRILGREDFFLDQVELVSERRYRAEVVLKTINLLPRYFIEIILVFFVVMLVGVVTFLDTDINQYIPMIAMFVAAGMRIGPSAATLTGGISQLRRAVPAVSELANDLRGNKQESRQQKHDSSVNNEVFQSLELSKVSYRYAGFSQYVLKNVSLRIRPGDCIGIVGVSGAGKTTLVDVILGLLPPTSGEILLNGKELSLNPKMWSGVVAYLPQEHFLLDDSIERNVSLSEKINDLEKREVEKTLREAQLFETIDGFPEGVATIVGEGGARLSGGQRQRLSIARAFYFKRDVLIFDEATSALDNDTEREIVAEIKKLKGKSTMIVIAHRESTLEACDQIYRLSDGLLLPHGVSPPS